MNWLAHSGSNLPDYPPPWAVFEAPATIDTLATFSDPGWAHEHTLGTRGWHT